MDINNKECEALIGLVKLKYKVNHHRHRLISNRKHKILTKIHSYTCNPCDEMIEDISYLLNLPGFVIHKWFKMNAISSNSSDNKLTLKILVMLCLTN